MLRDDIHVRRTLARSILERLAETAPTEDGRSGKVVRMTDLVNNSFAVAYGIALVDMLRALGAVIADPEDATVVSVSSVQAGYFIHEVCALLENDTPLVADWTREGVNGEVAQTFEAGVNLLAALEQRRLKMTANAGPIRNISVAVGVIAKRNDAGERTYLFFWDEPARRWQLIGGHFEMSDGSLKTTLLRELSEELQIPPVEESVHVLVTEVGQPFIEKWRSPTYGLLTNTIFQAYGVRFMNGLPPLHDQLRWVTEQEVFIGRTTDGETISNAPLHRLLTQPGINLDMFLLD
ncbi:MAG: hypothetical protein GFH27_549287n58 [Chloroflexi bacterium AL-W]|nr:hypothetical protein [Chloroflexi bacterium AL-N1]NOK66332.1 hypothetical protein [Chloroflexi bacterium AL-N10]NOK71720.1 hypothetical protein [Chloroflexi bacterium AL-N5]NOK80977.1 hypothetical protein [Chloroflexi bacterium AL-W]NOK89250.1 hypothetical protein [Chloroflexi bacterium AL-N15]